LFLQEQIKDIIIMVCHCKFLAAPRRIRLGGALPRRIRLANSILTVTPWRNQNVYGSCLNFT
jgi:hypothetical protein